MLRISNKKGGFIGWFLFFVLILFIAVPLIVGGITNQLGSSDLLARAEVNCYSIIPTKAISGVLCRPVFVDYGKGTNQSLPLLFVLITFVLTAVLIYALIEDVPPFKNQIQNHRRGPAAVFTILIAAMVSFFTSTPKYVTILLTLSGSVIVYTVIAVFLVFIFLRIGLHSHKEGLKVKKEYYKDLGKEKKEIRALEREDKDVSRDIKLSKGIEKELKQLKKNDFQELQPLEKLESVLKSFEGPISKINAITDPKEQEHALKILKEHMPEVIKLTHRIEKEYHDEQKIDSKKDKLNNVLRKRLADARNDLTRIENRVQMDIQNSKKNKTIKSQLLNELNKIRDNNQKLFTEITEYENRIQHFEKELDDMRKHKAYDIRAILDKIRGLAHLIANGSLPTSKQILDTIKDIDDLKALIKHNEVIISSINKFEDDVKHLMKRIDGAIGELQELEKKTV